MRVSRILTFAALAAGLVLALVQLGHSAPVGVWHMDETSGTIADASGNGNDGTFDGAAADYGHFSPLGTALYFNGGSDVNVGNGFDLDDRSFTVEAWIRPDSGRTSNSLIASKPEPDPVDGDPLNNLHLRIYPDNHPRFGFHGGDLDGPAGAVASEQWQHIAFVFEKTGTANNNRYIYVNGAQVDSDTPSYVYEGSGGNFFIGSWGNSEYFEGFIDEVRVYHEALDATTVANHAGGLYETNQPEAIVLAHNNEEAANPIEDSSFWNNDGTYSGSRLNSPGRFLNGIGYDGVDDWTGVADSTEINFADRSFTVEAWVKQDVGATGEQVIVSKRDTPATDYEDLHLRVLDNGAMRFGFHGDDLNVPSGSITQGQWHHVAFVMEAGTTNNRYIYVDGTQVAHDSPTKAYQGDGGAINFGRWFDGSSGQHFQGVMDEPRIYNYALDAAAIARHADGQYQQFQPEVPLLVMQMEDASGPIQDATGAYTGNYTGSQYQQPGIYGQYALEFDGNDRIEVASDGVLDFDERSFTVEMWVNQDPSSSGQQVVMSKIDQGGDDRNMHLRIYDDGLIRMDWFGNSANTDPGTFEAGQWHHLAFTYDYNDPDYDDPSNGSGVRRIFYDGQIVDEELTATPYLGSGGTMYIGSWGDIQYFKGLIDEFRVYNYALDPAMVLAHFNRQYDTFVIPEPGSLALLLLGGLGLTLVGRCRRPR